MEMKAHYINGAMYDGCSDEHFTTYNPANGEPLANIKQANQDDLEAAIESAKKGFAARERADEPAHVLARGRSRRSVFRAGQSPGSVAVLA